MTQQKSSCHELISSLSDFIDGELEKELCEKIESHLAECQNCRIVVDTLRKTITLYQQTSIDTDLPTEVRSRLFKRLDLEDLLKK
ncbi:MAG: anti-sigma factor family protein [Anaerolineales bacterium]